MLATNTYKECVMDTATHRTVLEEVQHDIAALRSQLEKLIAVADYHSQKLGLAQNLIEVNGRETPSTAPTPPVNKFSEMNQREAAEAILAEAGTSMRAVDIAHKMVAGGYPPPKKIGMLANALFTNMTRNPERFKKVGSGLWSLNRPSPKQSATG